MSEKEGGEGGVEREQGRGGRWEKEHNVKGKIQDILTNIIAEYDLPICNLKV